MPNPPSDLHEEDLVRIVAGPWKGCRAIINRMLERSNCALVTVEHGKDINDMYWSTGHYIPFSCMERYEHAKDSPS